MNLLIIINGKKDILLEKLGWSDENLTVKKIDDKVLADFKGLKAYIKSVNPNELWFGNIQNDLQRFHFFILLYVFWTSKLGGMIDENGNKIPYSFLKLWILLFPKLIIEAMVSSIVLIRSIIKYRIDKWILEKN